MANNTHYFLGLKLVDGGNAKLKKDWENDTEGVALFVSTVLPPVTPKPTDPDFLIGTKLGVGFSPGKALPGLPNLTIQGNAAIGYDPSKNHEWLEDGLKVKGGIHSDEKVTAPDATFDKAQVGTVASPIAKLESEKIVLGAADFSTSVQIQSGKPSWWKTTDELTLQGSPVVIVPDPRTARLRFEKLDNENGVKIKTNNGKIHIETVHDATMLGHSTAIHLRADKGRINIDGPTYIESTNKPDNPTRLQVTDGPIVQVQSVGDNKDPTKLDGKHIVIGNGIRGDIDYLRMTEHYGMRMVWQDSVAGFQLQDITKPEQPTTRDTVMFWGDDAQNRFRIRFVGNVPDYLDHKATTVIGKKTKGKPRKKPATRRIDYADLNADDQNRSGKAVEQGMRKRNPAFSDDGARKFRDIVVIEPDGSFKVNGSVYAYQHRKWSDSRLKESIKPIRKALDKVNAMRGVSYRWRLGEIEDMPLNDRRQLGLLAQEIEKVCPEVVTTEKVNDRPTKTVDYTQIVPVLIEAIKEQQATIAELQTRLVTLEKRVGAAQVPSANPRLKKRSSKRYDA